MKEKKGRRRNLANNKRKEKDAESENDDAKSEEFERGNNDSDITDNENTTSIKRHVKDLRRSNRKAEKKSFAEAFDSDDDEDEDDEILSNSPRKSLSKRSTVKKSRVNENELNGEKVQTQTPRKDKRRSFNKSEQISLKEFSDNESEKETDEKQDDKPLIKSTKKNSKRKSSTKALEAKKSKFRDDKEDDNDEVTEEEYEVEKLIDIYFKKNGDKEFLVRWKGYSSKHDTWEPEKHLNCQELIEAFLEKCEKAKSMPLREMRVERKQTERYVVNEEIRGRKLSARLKQKPRKTYYDVE